ncbi:flagellar protein FliL [Halobacillus andaensis]|uniref:Flagellar protein FliL n=1 Tax=Halobacillus andaensis TaxID=1176239 RepID=A0A917EVD4_HALAA|nr:flagellar basal body-associated protein FliL [Halobacillus andaensis]MBP2003487.1 flagellar FliL protein [Halobacillus andaensis]GGF10982.1 flagellar protein FliL [Halobacillus andaensis]
MKNKVFKTMLVVLGSITVIGVVALVLVLNLSETEADGERSIDDIREASLITEDITTDIQGGDFVRISFRVVTDGEDALRELEKRDFQMQNILIKELATMEEEDFTSNLDSLEEEVRLKLNELMNEGQVTEVYTVDKVLQ